MCSLSECVLNANILASLASCSMLRGLIIDGCSLGSGGERATDANLSAVLRACSELRWLFIQSPVFGEHSWGALAAEGNCPDLEVLWVDEDRARAHHSDPNSIRSALAGRADKLKLCMINPDLQHESRYVAGRAGRM